VGLDYCLFGVIRGEIWYIHEETTANVAELPHVTQASHSGALAITPKFSPFLAKSAVRAQKGQRAEEATSPPLL